MLSPVNNIYPRYNYNFQTNYQNLQTYNSANHYDCVDFTGKSPASQYRSVFDYLSAEILDGNKKFDINSGLLSAKKITSAIKKLFTGDLIYSKYDESNVNKIKWKSYIPEDIRVYSIEKINKARHARLKQWSDVLTNPENIRKESPELAAKLNGNNSLKFVIWNAVTSEIKTDNRHIPVPFNEKALLETINRFEGILPIDRAVTCAKPSFLEYYTHRLRDNVLMDMGLSKDGQVWVKIPSIKHDLIHKDKNIQNLEILSNRNWCTRSSVDKAEDALTDGDFYIMLKRNPMNMWEPLVGMTTHKGKIDQIQGKDNDNIIPLNLVGDIKAFIEKSELSMCSGVFDEGPKAVQAILISEKLNQKDGKISLAKAIKDKDFESVFNCLGVQAKKNENGKLEIKEYKPTYVLDKNRGYVIPYSMFGIDEDALLQSVEKINGDFVLKHKNRLLNTTLKKFPPNLKEVTGYVVVSEEQYAKYHDDILRVVNGKQNKVIVKKI